MKQYLIIAHVFLCILFTFSCGREMTSRDGTNIVTHTSTVHRKTSVQNEKVREHPHVEYECNTTIYQKAVAFERKLYAHIHNRPAKPFEALTLSGAHQLISTNIPLRQKLSWPLEIATSCRNYTAGEYVISNIYRESRRANFSVAYEFGKCWGDFALHHRKFTTALDVYEKTIQDIISDGTHSPETQSLIARCMYWQLYTYNMKHDFENSALMARNYLTYVTSKDFPSSQRVCNPWYTYVRELCNNEQYDKAMEVVSDYNTLFDETFRARYPLSYKRIEDRNGRKEILTCKDLRQ